MLYNTFELIFQVSSNLHLMFCFCNLIIFVLIAESLKPRSNGSVIHSTSVTPSSLRADFHGVISNASSIKVTTDDHDAKNGQHFADKLQLSDCQMIDNSEEQGKLGVDSTETGSLELQTQLSDCQMLDNSEEQGKLRVDSTETGSLELQIYDELSPENEEVNSSSEEELQGPEGVGDDYDEDGDELTRKIEEFIAKVNKEWRKEKLISITDD